MYQVLYYSRGGNTRKLAAAIAGELGVKASDIGSMSLDPNAKVIFLGSGVYAGKPGEDLMRFVEAHDFHGRKVRIFSTSWITGENAFAGVVDALRRNGATVLQGYHCKGRAGIFNLGHPNREDLDKARQLTREMVKAG
jgi:flavodoxin I